jgi:hypothetical protein
MRKSAGRVPLCVLYYCHRVATQLQLTNIFESYHHISQVCTGCYFRETKWPTLASKQLRMLPSNPSKCLRYNVTAHITCKLCYISREKNYKGQKSRQELHDVYSSHGTVDRHSKRQPCMEKHEIDTDFNAKSSWEANITGSKCRSLRNNKRRNRCYVQSIRGYEIFGFTTVKCILWFYVLWCGVV